MPMHVCILTVTSIGLVSVFQCSRCIQLLPGAAYPTPLAGTAVHTPSLQTLISAPIIHHPPRHTHTHHLHQCPHRSLLLHLITIPVNNNHTPNDNAESVLLTLLTIIPGLITFLWLLYANTCNVSHLMWPQRPLLTNEQIVLTPALMAFPCTRAIETHGSALYLLSDKP